MDVRDAPLRRICRAGAVTLVLASVAVVAACGPTTTPEEQSHNQEVMDRIGADFEAEGFTVEAASFRDDVENDAKVYLFLRCQDCDQRRVVRRAARAVWSSTVSPLHTFSVKVLDTEELREARRDAVVATDEDTLTEEFGERPVSSEDGDPREPSD
ncbi:MAG TPA: hypothetical protein VGE14_07555 [Marmoricola sp.]